MTSNTKTLQACSVSLATLGIIFVGLSANPTKEIRLLAIEILYPLGGSLLDRLCRSDFRINVDDRTIAAAVQKRAEFQKEWDSAGPVYLRTALNEIGLDFPYSEMQATLTVCLPASTSTPLIIDVRGFLPSAKKSAPEWEFSEVVFHELMHTYITYT